jgi:toxin FitB
MLIDSNIIIYAAKPEHANLRRFIADHTPVVSAVSYVEVPGYHKLSADERKHFEAFFAAATVLPLSNDVLNQAIKLRQLKKMTLGDSLVAGTALVHGHILVTRNVKDYAWISGLELLDPFAAP